MPFFKWNRWLADLVEKIQFEYAYKKKTEFEYAKRLANKFEVRDGYF